MGATKIVEVTTKSQLRKFVNFPIKMYKDVPQYIPNFYSDDLGDWDKTKNPAFSYCEARAFLAYRGDTIVGRIAAILNTKANETWHTNRMRFSQVDFIDDPEVSKALFDTVENWAREKGCTEIHGPLGFTDLDREGMLVDGFELRGMFTNYYNFPYYNTHLAALGYVKDVDWIEYKILTPDVTDKNYLRIGRLAEMVMKRNNYHIAQVKKKSDYTPYIKKVFELVNIAYADLYGVTELSQKQIDKYAKKFIPLVNPDYLCMVMDEKEELAGFGVCAPSMAEALRKSRGRLFPLGWIRILHALKKNNAVDLLLIAVRPKLQKTGINAVIIDHIMNGCIRNGIEYGETGNQLELNSNINNQWKNFDITLHKRRRCYVKAV